MAAAIKGEDVWVETAVLNGHPAEELAQYASERACGVIAMSTHGRSGTGRWVYGSTADKLLQLSPIPVFLIRAQESPPAIASEVTFKTVIVPLDGSNLGEAALSYATSVAGDPSLKIALVRVAPSDATYHGMMDPEFFEPSMYENAVKLAQDYLQDKKAELEAERYPVTVQVEEGFPADQIVEYAKGIDNSFNPDVGEGARRQ